MILLNLRFQIDTPKGLEDVHAFVQDAGDGYDVYCRHSPIHPPTTIHVPDFPTAMVHINSILAACAKEVRQWKLLQLPSTE